MEWAHGVTVEEVGLWLCSYAARKSVCLVQNFGVGGVGVGVGVCSARGSQSCAARNSCVLWQKNRTKCELQLAKTACLREDRVRQGWARLGKAGQGRARLGSLTSAAGGRVGGLAGRQAGRQAGRRRPGGLQWVVGIRGQQAGASRQGGVARPGVVTRQEKFA